MNAISQALGYIHDRLPEIRCRLEEPMKNHTSLRIGGPVRAMLFPETTEELVLLCEALKACDVTPLIMGNGTNMLVDDGSLDIIVINTTMLRTVSRTGETEIAADAGASMSKLAVLACDFGLSGLEFAHGIPGTLGGAVMMNAGAYGGEMKDVVCSTNALGRDTGVFTVAGEEHGFSYRTSRFFDSGEIILSSVLKLQIDDKRNIKAKMDELAERRRISQPLDLPSAGSTFKRPKEGYAAALIEQAGLKGYMIGGAQVSEKHSGFVVNRGSATFSDVLAVVDHVAETVFKKTGAVLELEIKIVR